MSYVEGRWSPVLAVTFGKIAGVTAHLNCQVSLPNYTGGPFSLRRGLNYGQNFFKLGIT